VPEDQSLDPELLKDALAKGLADADIQNVKGKLLTPFLLDSIRRATGDRSLSANCALLIANAQLAGELAVALGKRSGTSQ
jgi:pseudouridine-5'-phosphate glycosidase